MARKKKIKLEASIGDRVKPTAIRRNINLYQEDNEFLDFAAQKYNVSASEVIRQLLHQLKEQIK